MNALKDEGGENVRTGEWPKPMGYFQAVSLLPFLPLAGWTRGDMMGGEFLRPQLEVLYGAQQNGQHRRSLDP